MPPVPVADYQPDQVLVTYDGLIISGFADGSMVKIERNVDTFSLVVGSDGHGARTRSANKSGKVTISLLQTSVSNDDLSAKHAIDEAAGTGKGPLMVRDLSGRTLAHAEQAWVTKPAASDFGKEVGSREWVIETDRLELFVKGN